MVNLRRFESHVWNIRIKGRWYRSCNAGELFSDKTDRSRALTKIKQLCDQPDNLDEWEEAPFPAPLSSDSSFVYTVDIDAGTLGVTYFKMVGTRAQSQTDWYDLRTVCEASSLSSVKCCEKPQPLPTQLPGKIGNDELAQLTLEPLHLVLDFPLPLNELQARLYIHFLCVWRWHFIDPSTWRYDSPAMNYFCIAILRLAAWDLEVCPEGNIYWFRGFLIVLHDNLEDQSMVRSAVRKAQQYLERTTNQRRHTRLIIMSTCHIVFAEIADDTVRASSPSMLLSTMSGVQQSAGFRALCVILTSNCWPERMTSREEWKLPWEIILLILSNLDRRTVDALAHASTPVRMRCYPRTFQSQDIPQLANVGVMNYPLLIHCCGKRSGLEESGVMCSVCYSWQHTDCINLNALPSHRMLRAPRTCAGIFNVDFTTFNTKVNPSDSLYSKTRAVVLANPVFRC
ncbi:uncharacterized protein BO96DRAFT_392863 [Aspergillus niger CBS 101883]|uniref:Uncharacterized protein n=1 Tax=Aspergillus niger ATCC 13496 TaxID=1353008 RepID=A0A370BKX5_ASPNG|nr:hypothetical protein ANI_1_2498074 [Aspergillus niger CBS 513.88]XP_025454607.1 uncharacterized protein BO96DRAFT_392863 [Aspergillus niger CBS 101883]PYH56552.1 hypothetical protein BO96DRAFT_392863 [Aspergillus niger CBS 101883]RDH16234.1 hypothetical protein M747DRAFT_318130 [Aspergillus niger ATCC 13496]|eukprot:XP_001393198.2 hypothetical protein ANI_1_2498074 [Aspergillus niger CBS 513.88]